MLERLTDSLYVELRALAAREMRRERPEHTLSATALLHEALVRLQASETALDSQVGGERRAIHSIAAVAMRRVLVDHARARLALKRGTAPSPHMRIDLDKLVALGELSQDSDCEVMLAFDAALTRLEQVSEKYAEVVRLRFFAGLSIVEAAASLGISPRTANSYWQFARAWLARELQSLAPE